MFKTWKRITAGFAAACCLLASIPSVITSADDGYLKYEAEDAVLGGTYEIKESTDASAGKYVTFEKDFTCEFTVNVDKAGYYDFNVISGSDHGEKKNSVAANGVTYGQFISPKGTFGESTVRNVKLNKGNNKVTIVNNESWFNLDYFTVSESETVKKDYYSTVNSTLVNPNATASAKRLMKYLCDSYGNVIISGQQADKGYSSSDVKGIQQLTGELPAIIGLDLMDYSPATVEQHGGSGSSIERAIEVSEQGGIVAMCWHWRMYDEYLKSGTDGSNPRWWSSFYSKNIDFTKFDLEKIMNDPTCKEYKLLVKDIKAIAQQLKILQDKDIPVLFRPLHEGGGDYRYNNPWFWWGSGGSEAYVKLWKLMYSILTDEEGLNNLIWVWNGQIKDYYPGDEYVDIIGEDIYNDENDFQPNSERFIRANEYTSASKLVVLSENGNLFDPEDAFEINAKWGYFTSWSGDYSVNGSYNNADNKAIWKKVYNSDKVITLSELPDLKTYPIDDNIPATDIKVDITEKDLTLGESFNITATYTPQNATEIPTWTSSDTKVATVKNGKVTSVGIGEAVITCKLANGKTASCKVSVKPTQVSNLKAVSTTTSSITLTWDAVPTADDYEIMVMDSDGKQLNDVFATSNTFEVKGLDSDTVYKFRVKAHKVYNKVDFYGEYSAIINASTKKENKTPEPNKINTDDSSNGNDIPKINGNTGGTTTINATNSVNKSDNSANTGSTALTTFGLALAGAIVILSKKKK